MVADGGVAMPGASQGNFETQHTLGVDIASGAQFSPVAGPTPAASR